MPSAHIVSVGLVLIVLAPAASAQTAVDPGLMVEVVLDLPSPTTAMAFLGEDEFIVTSHKDGKVRRVIGGLLQPEPILDLAVHSWVLRGLLGVATDPDFVNNSYVYLYYAESPTGKDTNDPAIEPLGERVYRYRWDGSALVEPLMILDLPAGPGPDHSGGPIVFGPDDRLYQMSGDRARSGPTQNQPEGAHGPIPDDTSVILRVSVLGSGLADNPLVDPVNATSPLNRYFAYGIRNSFGMAFDPVTGDLWDTENGHLDFDEINRVVPGFNSGWKKIQGPVALSPNDRDELWMVPGAVYGDPQLSWKRAIGITAVGFIRTPKLGCHRVNAMLVGAHVCNQLYYFELDPTRSMLRLPGVELRDGVVDNDVDKCTGEQDEILFATDTGSVTDIDVGADGLVYLVQYAPGRILRIRPVPGGVSDADGDQVDDACDCDPADASAYGLPAEVPRVRLSGPAPTTTVGWDTQSATAGSGITYTVVSGRLDELFADGGFATACRLGTGLVEPTLTDDRPEAAPGDGVYFLVRAENGCGSGSFGTTGELPDPRQALSRAVLPDCGERGMRPGRRERAMERETGGRAH